MPDTPSCLHRRQARSHIWIAVHQIEMCCCAVALLLLQPLRSATRPPCSAFDLDLFLTLILGAPSTTLAERRLESVGNPAGRRVSRVGPWMARHGGPRIQVCVRAHRAQARCRVVGQEPFGYFGAFPKCPAVRAEPIPAPTQIPDMYQELRTPRPTHSPKT